MFVDEDLNNIGGTVLSQVSFEVSLNIQNIVLKINCFSPKWQQK